MVEAVEKKVPKGVPLQFDINSVGKPVSSQLARCQAVAGCPLTSAVAAPPQQTAMTLNERFRILKDKRAAAAQAAKGSRFVTVG